jgi:regulator of protease activity HflC (stomatin/prohibitin superfamily)
MSESSRKEPTPDDRYLKKMAVTLKTGTHREGMDALLLRVKARLSELAVRTGLRKDGIYRLDYGFYKTFRPVKEAFQSAIAWASQTALRDVIGKTMLSDMLEGRDKISALLQKIIDQRTEPWGINVISVEIKDVLIPAALEDAMSMQAQAERERQARVILGDSERQVAEKFAEAAKSYDHNPVAFHLRAMNMLYEGLKKNATIVIVPSTAVESMQLGGMAGLTALTMGLGKEQRANGDKETELVS